MLAVAVVAVLAAALPVLAVVLAVHVAGLSACCQLAPSQGLDLAEQLAGPQTGVSVSVAAAGVIANVCLDLTIHHSSSKSSGSNKLILEVRKSRSLTPGLSKMSN